MYCYDLGLAGQIINKILDAGFEVSAMQMFCMEKANAEEFYEVYKGVVQEYTPMVEELTCGPCIAMEIRASNVHTFREMVGPADPVSNHADIDTHIQSHTLRHTHTEIWSTQADPVSNHVDIDTHIQSHTLRHTHTDIWSAQQNL